MSKKIKKIKNTIKGKTFEWHGMDITVTEVLANSVICEFPDGSEDDIDINELIEQDICAEQFLK